MYVAALVVGLMLPAEDAASTQCRDQGLVEIIRVLTGIYLFRKVV